MSFRLDEAGAARRVEGAVEDLDAQIVGVVDGGQAQRKARVFLQPFLFSLELARRSSAASHMRFSMSLVLAGISFLVRYKMKLEECLLCGLDCMMESGAGQTKSPSVRVSARY